MATSHMNRLLGRRVRWVAFGVSFGTMNGCTAAQEVADHATNTAPLVPEAKQRSEGMAVQEQRPERTIKALSTGEEPRLPRRTQWSKEPQLVQIEYNLVGRPFEPDRRLVREFWQRVTVIEANEGETRFTVDSGTLRRQLEPGGFGRNFLQKYAGTAKRDELVTFEELPTPEYGQASFVLPVQSTVMSFPSNPIGVGATWRTEGKVSDRSSWNQISSYELLGASNSRLIVHRRDCNWSRDPDAMALVSSEGALARWQELDALVVLDAESPKRYLAGRAVDVKRFDLETSSQVGFGEAWVSFDVRSGTITPGEPNNLRELSDDVFALDWHNPKVLDALASTHASYLLPSLMEKGRDDAEVRTHLARLVQHWFGVELSRSELWLTSARLLVEQGNIEDGLERFARLMRTPLPKEEKAAVAVGYALLLEAAHKEPEAGETLAAVADEGELLAQQALVWWLATRSEVSARDKKYVHQLAKRLLAGASDPLSQRVAAAAHAAAGHHEQALELIDQALQGMGKMEGYRGQTESLQLRLEQRRYSNPISRNNPRASRKPRDTNPEPAPEFPFPSMSPSGPAGLTLRELTPRLSHHPRQPLQEDSWCRLNAVPETAWGDECTVAEGDALSALNAAKPGTTAPFDDAVVWCPFDDATTAKLVRHASEDQRAMWGEQRALLLAKNKPTTAVQALEEVVRRTPTSHVLNSLAWILATTTNSKLRDGRRAVDLAQQALRMQPNSLATMDTLAAAYAESGRFTEAAAWQQRVVDGAAQVLELDSEGYAMRLQTYLKHQPYRTADVLGVQVVWEDSRP